MRITFFSTLLFFVLLVVGARALAQEAAAAPPDDTVLGTIDVNGSSGNGLPPLPKLAVLPLLTQGNADTIVQLVTRRDLELSGQFEVVDSTKMPGGGVFMRDQPIDWSEWQKTGTDYVVRVYATTDPKAKAGDTQLVAEVFVAPTKPQAAGDSAALAASPSFVQKISSPSADLRINSHRLVDALLGGITGRPGCFASHMVYASKVGKWRRIFELDSDGFNLHPFGPSNATVISPTFGPGGQVVYAISQDFRPFRLAMGPNATPIPMTIDGSIMGLAFSPDRSQMLIALMNGGASKVALEYPFGNFLQNISSQPLANGPAFGPNGRTAYVAGQPIQRVYVGSKAISPGGFMASAPSFCDTPQGVMVIFTVGVGQGADIIATDTAGGSIRRLTQKMGSNMYATCSPDGRLIAFFSSNKNGKGPGLYVAPILRPWLAKKISNEVGESLKWDPI